MLFTILGLRKVLAFDSEYPVVWIAIERRFDPSVIESNFVTFIEYLLESVAGPIMLVPTMFGEVVAVGRVVPDIVYATWSGGLVPHQTYQR